MEGRFAHMDTRELVVHELAAEQLQRGLAVSKLLADAQLSQPIKETVDVQPSTDGKGLDLKSPTSPPELASFAGQSRIGPAAFNQEFNTLFTLKDLSGQTSGYFTEYNITHNEGRAVDRLSTMWTKDEKKTQVIDARCVYGDYTMEIPNAKPNTPAQKMPGQNCELLILDGNDQLKAVGWQDKIGNEMRIRLFSPKTDSKPLGTISIMSSRASSDKHMILEINTFPPTSPAPPAK